jgi:hypothetical protein
MVFRLIQAVPAPAPTPESCTHLRACALSRKQLPDKRTHSCTDPGTNGSSIPDTFCKAVVRLFSNGVVAGALASEWLRPVLVHKASHHGSMNGDTTEGMALLAPKAMVIGVGAGNTYGHPDQAALQLYANASATVYRTDQHGTVIVEAQPSGAYTVRVERGEGAQPPPAPAPSTSARTGHSKSSACGGFSRFGRSTISFVWTALGLRGSLTSKLRARHAYDSRTIVGRLKRVFATLLLDERRL